MVEINEEARRAAHEAAYATGHKKLTNSVDAALEAYLAALPPDPEIAQALAKNAAQHIMIQDLIDGGARLSDPEMLTEAEVEIKRLETALMVERQTPKTLTDEQVKSFTDNAHYFHDAVQMACDNRLQSGKHALREAEEKITRLEGEVARLREDIINVMRRLNESGPGVMKKNETIRAVYAYLDKALASTGPTPIADRSMEPISEIKLQKRPVAFRARNKGSDVWALTSDEEAAAKFANESNTEYQGLYVRDGTPRPDEISEAVAAETERCAKIADSFARAAMQLLETKKPPHPMKGTAAK